MPTPSKPAKPAPVVSRSTSWKVPPAPGERRRAGITLTLDTQNALVHVKAGGDTVPVPVNLFLEAVDDLRAERDR